MFEKNVKIISIVRVGTTIVDIEKKVHENSECLKVLMMKKNEVADDTVPKDYSCKKCESIFQCNISIDDILLLMLLLLNINIYIQTFSLK